MTTTTRNFLALLEEGWKQDKFVCVGLDADVSRLPPELRSMDDTEALIEFNRQIISVTSGIALAYKPQSAMYEKLGLRGPEVLLRTIEMVNELAPSAPVILDAKRADIDSTNDAYVAAAFGFLSADAITVHPYLGPEAMSSFLDQRDKGIIVLCRTSNKGAGRYQDRLIEGRPLYQIVAEDVAATWNYNGNCSVVVGATYPAELREVRQIVGDLPILIPGIGAQGGDVHATVESGMDSRRAGMIINSSRGLIYAYEKYDDCDFAEATRRETFKLHTQINDARS